MSNPTYAVKQVLVLRKDLGMRTGKMVVQGSHASRRVVVPNQDHPLVIEWQKGNVTPSACVRVESEAELVAIYEAARAAGLLCSLVEDLGFTEFHGVATKTCVAVGPGLVNEVDLITGHLKTL
jgi:PTH2 family peptidyl-tRNA hydrolase